mmetsp:Transcript_14545/g.31670  ORF Transcript_14545/g.31670 Transcript_14545/m.31670 type:complete len:245 (-) Transcript_14545:810-1544(-)
MQQQENDELSRAKIEATQQRRRADALEEELRLAKQQYVLVQTQLEQEEECITNKLIKRLDELKKEKAQLVCEVEQEEELVSATLRTRLQTANHEHEAVIHKLQVQLDQLRSERNKLHAEKIELENQLEAEQEFIMNKLQKQLEKLGAEKKGLQRETSELQLQIKTLAQCVERLNLEKVKLEQELEVEEEKITNRLQRQVESLVGTLRGVESALAGRGLSLKDLGLSSPLGGWGDAYVSTPRRSP